MKFKCSDKYTEIIFGSKSRITLPEYYAKIFVIDKVVFHIYTDLIKKMINDSPAFYLESNEKNKSFTTACDIYSFFQRNKVNRSTIIVGIGGGVTTDLTAFCASTFMRGCKLWLIPTTFLAMIDAAIGGKTAVNFLGIKNNIGTFYPAEKIIVLPEFLDTLSKTEMDNGWAECIKVSLIQESNLYNLLLRKSGINNTIIKEAIKIKMSICKSDLEDKNERKHLNLGHTFAHILESISNYEMSHGTAVSIGIRAAAKLSLQSGLINVDINEKINHILDLYNLPSYIDAKYRNILIIKGETILNQDKKAAAKINLVLFKEFQKVFLKEIDDNKLVLNILKDFCK